MKKKTRRRSTESSAIKNRDIGKKQIADVIRRKITKRKAESEK